MRFDEIERVTFENFAFGREFQKFLSQNRSVIFYKSPLNKLCGRRLIFARIGD
ncbi:MAG: hypothetical protein H7Z37_15995 [Pyrinomonadaceae bacterium]|nr:hypothetical protein [Pyrinomonadaceae bacterium]